jgi:serine/threonine-protein kinase
LAIQQQSTSSRLRPFKPTQFGRYTLLMPLSVGGMGEIFLARLEGVQGFEKLCVIKKILPHLAQDPDFVSRFVNEARTLVKLTHGSIAQVLDMGLHQNEPYLALEYIDGKDLRKIATRGRERNIPLPLTFVLFVMSRVLDALAYAHRKRDDDEKEIGLVHRDVSPQNILISYEGEVKVIDFGLAKSTLNSSKTNPSIILGKFLYMSPEQARHVKVDRRSDLYSVGLCLYELISGRNPFEEVAPHALMAAVASPSIPHVQQIEPLCPANIAQIIMRALSVDPGQRFQTAEELRGKLLAALLEIDPSAGPESCSRFMRETFSAEYSAERKLLATVKESAPRLEATVQIGTRPLREVRPSSPRIEPPPENETTPGPTDMRRYGLEPTVPGTKALPSALSFAPTPKMGGDHRESQNDRETVPGIVLNPLMRTVMQPSENDRPTGPHPGLMEPVTEIGIGRDPPPEEVPTRQVVIAQRPLRPLYEPPTGPEPVTSQIEVAPVSSDSQSDLPSVVVGPMTTPPGAQKVQFPGRPGPRPSGGGQVLIPATSVRAPEITGPLPKALIGKGVPDHLALTDRGTKTRTSRTNLVIMLVPLVAVLGLATLVGMSLLRTWQQNEEDEDSPSRTGGKRMKLIRPGIANPNLQPDPPPPPPPPTEADDVMPLPSPSDDVEVSAPVVKATPAAKAPTSPLSQKLSECARNLSLHTRSAALQTRAAMFESSARTDPPSILETKLATCRALLREEQGRPK